MSYARTCVCLLFAACTALISSEDAGAHDGGAGGGGAGGGLASCSATTCQTGCCSGNACIPGGHPRGETCATADSCDGGSIGDPCTQDSDCCNAICHTTEQQLLPGATQLTPGPPYPGGYCTRRCASADDCAAAGVRCSPSGGPWGEALNLCLKTCNASSDCRSGYVCFRPPAGVCVPADASGTAPTAFDAGPPPTQIGRDCVQDSDCRSQTLYGYCLHGAGFASGECVADCTMTLDNAWCSGGTPDGGNRCDAVALHDDAGTPVVRWRCKQGCTTATDCKSGYHCATDGFGDLVCEPNCDNAGASTLCGAVCFTSWGCSSLTCSALSHSCH